MPDVPMYLVLLNVEKFTVNLILDWCSCINNERKIMRFFHDIFDAIYELKLEWAKLIPIRTSFGGWVSDNWLPFGRIL